MLKEEEVKKKKKKEKEKKKTWLWFLLTNLLLVRIHHNYRRITIFCW